MSVFVSRRRLALPCREFEQFRVPGYCKHECAKKLLVCVKKCVLLWRGLAHDLSRCVEISCPKRWSGVMLRTIPLRVLPAPPRPQTAPWIG